MPPQRRKKTNTNGKTHKQASLGTRTAIVRPPSNLTGLPSSRKVVLRYCDVSLPGALTGTNSFVCSANGCFDPNITATGHQPMLFDTWAAMYGQYVVHSSRIRASFAQASSSSTIPCVYGMYISRSNSLGSPGTWAAIAEQPTTAWVMATPDWDASSAQATLYAEFDAKQWFNVGDIQDNLDNLGAPVGANPAEQAYFHMFFAAVNEGAVNVAITVEIEYTVVFSEPKQLVQS